MRIEARRIVVIGTSCAGKTTFARALSTSLGIPHIELDALYWGPNWTPNADFRLRVERMVEGASWVTEGNYSMVRDLTWGRADLIVWLDYEMGVVVKRALKRTLHRAWTREPMWAGNRESFAKSFLSHDSILLWVLTTWRRRRHEYARIFGPSGPYHTKPHLRFRTPSMAEEFLGVLRSENLPAGQHAGRKSVQASSTS